MTTLSDGRNRNQRTSRSFLPDIGFDVPEWLQTYLISAKHILESLAVDPDPPGQPTAVTATAITAGTLLRWIKAPKAAAHAIYVCSTSSFTNAFIIQVLPHQVLRFTDVAGQYPGVTTNHYWIRGLSKIEVEGPLSLMVKIANPS